MRVPATNVPFNKRVAMPELADENTESKIAYARSQIKGIVETFCEKCKGMENLDKKQNLGLERLKQRAKSSEIVIFPTDKSSSLSVDTPTNYVTSMQKHYQNMPEITTVEYEHVEKLLNSHMTAWFNILGGSERLCRNYQATNNDTPPLYGLRKDHKQFNDLKLGPPTRPVCGAIVSCNNRISYFLSQILKPLTKSSSETCDSTEDLLHRIKVCNETEDLAGCVVGSMDVEALYPSIDVEFAVEKCCELIYDSDLQFENVDTEELGLFLKLIVPDEELKRHNIHQFCPLKKSKRGRPPTITSSGIDKNADKRWGPWNRPGNIPGENETRRMLVTAIGASIKATLQNHIFRFNSKLYRQLEGGAIGVALAGEIANLFMVWWDRQLKQKIVDDGISLKMYSRYVDDIDIATKGINPGSEENDKSTMERLQTIANSIHPSIRVTIDYPSNHPNKRLPVLDIEQWLDIVSVNGIRKPQLLHSHYMKEMTNRTVISKHSALSNRTKTNILVADLVRIMRNVSPLVDKKERTSHVQYFVKRMQLSGYNTHERLKVYQLARNRFGKIVEDDRNGKVPMYRSKFWNREERDACKADKKHNWYKNGGYETVFFVEATPKSELAIQCDHVFKDIGLKIRVVERAGTSTKQQLVKSDPFPRNKCASAKCSICDTNEKVNCKKRDVVYRITCGGDHGRPQGIYIGETSRSISERMEEHVTRYKNKDPNSVFYQHVQEEHNGVTQNLSLELLASAPGDAMLRQITEAVYIREQSPDLNRREEFGNSNVPRTRRRSVSASLQS